MSHTASFEHGYALLIGVGADLPVTIADAQGLYEILTDPERCGYPVAHVKLLLADQADRNGIMAGLNWLIDKLQHDPEGTAIIYFSGHGGATPTYYLVPFNYNPANLANTAISGAEFTAKIQAMTAKKLLILLDCCHAGGMADIKAIGFTKAPAPPELDSVLTTGSGKVVISSSRKDQVSYTGVPYSIFTQALREGLAGYGATDPDGYAYVADIAMYVGRVVPERTKNRQHPILKLAHADNFPVAYYAAGAKQVDPLPTIQSLQSPPAYHGVRKAELSPALRRKCREIMLRCEQCRRFDSLESLFAVVPLNNYIHDIRPDLGAMALVDRVIALLYDKRADDQWVFILFLQELRDAMPESDSRRVELDDLIDEVGRALTLSAGG